MTPLLAQLPTSVTVTFNILDVIVWVVVGLIAGTLASSLFNFRRIGLIGHLVIGLVGAFIGGALFNLLHIQISTQLILDFAPYIVDVMVAFVGALILLLLLGIFFWRRY